MIVCVPGMYPLWHLRVPRYYCARGPAVPWQLCLAAWPRHCLQPLDYLFALI